jgi:hypothetical protein
MYRTRREVTRRELLLLVVGACALSVVMNWPLVLHIGTHVPRDLGDPLPQSWQIAWDGYALAHQPLHFFQSNQFWPLPDTLAFSDALIGYAPVGLIGSGPEAAIAHYDLMFLFAYALAFAGAYLLARELGLGVAGATIAGAAFAFAPFRLEQDGHMQVISSGGIPLALALGLRGFRLRRPGWFMGAFLVATWQLTLGFTLGIPLGYLLGALGLIAGIAWLRRGRPSLDRRLVVATCAGAAIFVAAAAILVQPYLRVGDDHPGATRTPKEVNGFSGPAKVFLISPEENLVWGEATEGLRENLLNVPEKTLFPGLLTLALALTGVAAGRFSRRLRLGLLAGALFVSVLALGFQESQGLIWPYRWVYDFLPGWQAIRAPGRLVTLSSLGLGLLAGMGADRLLRARPLGRPRAAGAVAALLTLALLVEGRGLPFDPLNDRAQPRVPDPPADVSSVAAPQLHLPAARAEGNRRYLRWSTDGFPDILNGRSSLLPGFFDSVVRRVEGFPDRGSVKLLSRLGVASVILHTDRTQGTPWAGAARRSVGRLGISRSRRDDLVIYALRSPSAGSATGSGDASGSRRSR